MKQCFLIVLWLAAISVNAQLSYKNNYYFDCLSSSLQMNYAISLSSPKGNFAKANEVVSTDFFKSNPESAFYIKALLAYNTLGKKKAFEMVDSTAYSREQKDYAKVWLSFYTKNNDDYTSLLADFTLKYPQNYHVFKLKLREVINYRDARMWNVLKEKKTKALTTIDSLLTIANLNQEDRLYFSLLKIDFLSKKDYSKEEGYSEQKIAADLVSLWKANQASFSLQQLRQALSKCDTPDCKEILDYVAKEGEKYNVVSSSEKVYKMLINQNNGEDSKLSVAQIESAVHKLVAAEKNPKEVNRIKAMISVFSLEQAPSNVDFVMKDLLKPIPFTKAFKQAYAFPKQDKLTVLNDINAIIKSPEFESRAENSEFKKAIENLKNLSLEDLQVLNGIMFFQFYYSKSIREFKAAMGNFQEDLTPEAEKNRVEHFSFLEKNPLYYDDSKYFKYYFNFNTEAEIFQYIADLQKLKAQFPGAVGIQKIAIVSLARGNKLVSESKLQEFYVAYFKLVVDLLAVSQQENSNEGSEDNNYFGLLLNYDIQIKGSYFDAFFNAVMVDNQSLCIAYLEEALKNNPNQKNLTALLYKTTKFVGGQKYFEAVLSALENESYNINEPLPDVLLAEIDPQFIKEKLSKSEAILKAKGSYNLSFILDLYYLNDQASEATDLLIYLIKRNRDHYGTDEGTGQYVRELVQNLYEEEAIIQLTKLKMALPDCETSFILLLALEMKNNSKAVRALSEEFEKIVFYKSTGRISHTQTINFLKKRYFDEKTIDDVKQMIIKKYQKSEEYFSR